MPRPRARREIRARALQAGYRMADLAPDMVEFLNTLFYDQEVDRSGHFRVSAKERLGIAKFFTEQARFRAQMDRHLGLSKASQGAQGKDPLTLICNGDVTIFKGLPAEERRAAVLKMLRKQTEALPAPETPQTESA